jgi:putative CocE/NonD family hydrolase
VRLLKNVLIPTRDGTRLAADLYVPDGWTAEGGEPVPVVMEYIPYRKDDVPPGERFYEVLPEYGYVVARVDVRGTGGSEGIVTDEYSIEEQLDGYDAVEWLADQPWCDGHVNMMGISYGGFTSLQVASHAPPHLTSIVPMYFTDDRYTDDCHFRGGLLRKYYDVAHYGNLMVTYNAMPPHPDWSGGDFAAIWEQHVERNEPYLLKWFAHQVDEEYWRNGSVRDVADRIRCPVFMIGGWRDGYPNPPLRLFEALDVPRKALIGPWNHAVPDVAVPGPRIDHLREVARWLDHWCKDRDTGIMDEPPVVVFMQHAEPPVVDRLDAAGAWRAETEWPAPGAQEHTLYLGADGSLADAPGADGTDEYAYDPSVGVTGGLWSGGIPFGLPGDQRRDEALSLVYTTPPLEQDVHVLGRAQAVLHVATTATVMGFAVSVSDVAPDGISHLVAKGMLNGTRRASLREPAPMVPGEATELAIEVDAAAWVFPKGHRIRVAVASADWPNVWPTPEPGTNAVHRGAARPSRLMLPVVPAQGSAEPPRFEPSPVTLERQSDAADPPVWDVTDEILSGRRRVRIVHGRKQRIDAATVVERRFEFEASVDPARPAGAVAHGHHVSRIVRPNIDTVGRSDVLVQASATHFHLTIDLALEVNGMPHLTRRWVESIPRQLL